MDEYDEPTVFTNPEDPWPAEQLDQVSGDVFGNGASYLWRCEVCRGYFIAMDPDRLFGVVMGLVFDIEKIESKIEKARKRSEKVVASHPCNCEYHSRPQTPSLQWP